MLFYKQIFSVTFFQALEKILIFSAVPLITRKLSIIDYGIYNQVIIISSLLFIFIHLYLHEYMNNFYTGKSLQLIEVNYKKILLISLIFFTIIILITLVSSEFILKYILYNQSNNKIIYTILFLISSDAISKIISSFYRAQLKIIFANFIYVVSTISKILILLILIYFNFSLINSFFYTSIIIFIFSLIMVFLSLINIKNEKSDNVIISSNNDLYKYCFPLILLATFLWIANFGDRFLIIYLEDFEFFSKYAILYSISSLAYFIPFTLTLIFHPLIQKKNNTGHSSKIFLQYDNYLIKSNFLFIGLILFFLIFKLQILNLLIETNDIYFFEKNFIYIFIGSYFYGLFESTFIFFFIKKRNYQLLYLSISYSIIYFLLLILFNKYFDKSYFFQIFFLTKFLIFFISIKVINIKIKNQKILILQLLLILICLFIDIFFKKIIFIILVLYFIVHIQSFKKIIKAP